MEWGLSTISILLAGLILFLVAFRPKKSAKTPPGPKGIPVFGNLLQLGSLPHDSMHKWRHAYGPVIWLRLGSVRTMVVQSSTAAAELFKNHDLAFADRKCLEVVKAYDFNQGTLGQREFDGHWRIHRRLCSTEFINKRMNETTDLRHRMRENMEHWILEESAASRAQGGTGAVELSRCLFLMAFNLIGNLMLSKDLMDPKDPESGKFFDCVDKVMELIGTPNIADYLPWLKLLDPSGMKRSMKKNLSVTMRIASQFIQERHDDIKAGKKRERKDFLDVLLEYKGDDKVGGLNMITEKNIIIFITEMLMVGAGTTSLSIEWGSAELLRSPPTFKKFREELDRVVGVDRKVEEKDIENMPYLHAVVKEAFRLHPVAPLLLPRNTREDTNYMGYHIPKYTQVLVNMWAIGRDPDVWSDPLAFKPERFLGSNIDYKGQHFELIPFGAGRRICAGLPLAHRVVHLTIATLVQGFNWDLGSGVKPEDIDREEKFGVNLRKKNPLFVIPTKRLNA